MSPEALRRGGGVSAMADTKYAVAVSLKANSERHEGVGFLGRTVGSALSGVLLELFCRRGQKSGKKDKQQFTVETTSPPRCSTRVPPPGRSRADQSAEGYRQGRWLVRPLR